MKLCKSLGTVVFSICAAMPITSWSFCQDPPDNLYGLAASVSGDCGILGVDTVQDLVDYLDTNGLESIPNITYTGFEVIRVDLAVDALDMVVEYSTANSSVLTLNIDALGVNETFNGVDRDDSEEKLEDYLLKSGILGDIMNYQAENSPFSPIAGPTGLIPMMTAQNFNENFIDSGSSVETDRSSTNMASMSLQYSSLDILDKTSSTVTIPLSYNIRFADNPRKQIVISAPLSQIDTEGAKSQAGALGITYRHPLTDNWTLAPGFSTGAVYSEDMASAALVTQATLTSTYIWNLKNFDITMGNAIGQLDASSLEYGDYSSGDPDIQTTSIRNGFMLSQPITIRNRMLSIEYSAIDTRFTGNTEFYVDNLQEIGVTLGTNKKSNSAKTFFRGGLSYIHGEDTEGVTVKLGYWF